MKQAAQLTGSLPVPPTPRPFYGWRLAAVAGFVLALVNTPVFYGLGAFFVGMEREFGWSRTLISGAFALSSVEGAIIGPIAGYLIDRLGPRRLALIGLLIYGIGLLLFSLTTDVVTFYLFFLLVTVGTGLGGWLPMLTVVNNWFVRRRAMAMAVALVGGSLGGALVPALAWSVNTFGWRPTAAGIGVFTLLIAFPVTRLIRNRPEEYGQRTDGDPPTPSSGAAETPRAIATDKARPQSVDLTVAQAVRTRAFWLIALAHGLSAMATVALSVHAIPLLADSGLSLEMAGTVVFVFTIVGGVFQLVGGYLGDRLPKTLVIFAFASCQSAGVLLLAMTQGLGFAFLFAVLYGIGFGGRVPLLTAIRGDYFGRRSFATIMGLSQVPMTFLILFGPLFAGYVYDTTGTYVPALIALAALNFLGGLAILFARKPRVGAG